MRERLPAGLTERSRGEAERLPLRSALALGALLPAAVDQAALLAQGKSRRAAFDLASLDEPPR